MTSGLSGSPALTQWRRWGKRYADKSSRTMSRSAVGGAHQVVIGYVASVRGGGGESTGPGGSGATTHAPICHGPNTPAHAAFAQPVSVMHQCTSWGLRSSHNSPVIRWP